MVNTRHLRALLELTDCYMGSMLKSGIPVRLKVLRVQGEGSTLRVWALVRGNRDSVKKFLRLFAADKGSAYTILHRSGSTWLVHISMPACKCPRRGLCPMASPSGKVLALSLSIEKGRSLALIVVSSKKMLQELASSGYKIVAVEEDPAADELTPRQEAILLKAFELGYYSYPRRASLMDIAKATGLSVSTVAECLRKAEAKVISRFVKEDLLMLKYLNKLNGEGAEKAVEEGKTG